MTGCPTTTFGSLSTTIRATPPTSGQSSRPVCVAAVLDPVDGHNQTFVIDFVDDAVVATTGAKETGQFAKEWLADASRSFG